MGFGLRSNSHKPINLHTLIYLKYQILSSMLSDSDSTEMQRLEEPESEPPRKTPSFPSKDLPHDVVLNILILLPVKSLIRFRCVCKSWYFSISNPNFISNHLNQPKTYNNNNNSYVLYLTANIVGNQYHQDYLFCMAIGKSDGKLSSISRFKIPSITVDIVNYCNGLVCVAECYGPPIIYLWNPYIRKMTIRL